MRPGAVSLALGVGLHARVPSVCSVETALEFFNYGFPVPAACVQNLEQQARDYCNSFLSAETVTVYSSTVTPVTPFSTVTQTSTTVTTTTSRSTRTTATTATTSTTTTARVTTTTSSAFIDLGPILGGGGLGIFGGKRGVGARAPIPSCGAPVCIDPATSCIELTEPNLRRRPEAAMTEACNCLIPQGATTTVTLSATTASAPNTSTVTSTAVATSTLSETTITTTTSVSSSTRVSTRTVTTTVSAGALLDLS